ncbi:TPA: hypothetical protein N5L31_000776 [Enterobacter bugandensis]|uniref:hypothetical protein n=1 Tax=Enterobacter bugandensis TaxID=881260 RepID=UPI0020057CE1|nr:hypothetical protein [Enterobacter bugandensis]MCK7115148.1 hypothetical protein [Enterobacter bugandensis]MCK7446031.1 hypothetical protein [Enterobacter bugandensis]HCM9243514.1 hypothetical protein [Enterobacter bugandensis]
MKIIAHGKESIGAALATADVALTAGVSRVTIECTAASMLPAIATTLAYCPVVECRECNAVPCPFERKQADKFSEAQATYDLAAHNLQVAENNLRRIRVHG